MLVIRKEHEVVFVKQSRERFIDRLVNQINEDFKERLAQPDAPSISYGWVEKGLEKAKKYGITQEKEVGLFVFLMVMMGEKFDESPKNRSIRRILDDNSYEQEPKMELIYKILDDE